jgi:putative tricarboxylic transport membrane protein
MCIQINAKDSRFSNLDEFVTYAKENKVTLGTGGAAGIDEVVAAMFIRATGIKVDTIPYDKTGQMRAAVLAGDIDACTEEFGSAMSLIESGDMKPIVAFIEERAKDFPDCPTAVENGWDITLGRARGFVMAAGTPEPILEYLESATQQAYLTDEYKTWEKEQYLHLRPGWAGREKYTQQLRDELDMYSELLAELGYI